MTAYVIIDVDIHDTEVFAQYRKLGVPTLAVHGGKPLVRSDEAQTLEGGWKPRRLVLLQFDTAEQAKAWHASPEYQLAKKIRDRAARTESIVVQGV